MSTIPPWMLVVLAILALALGVLLGVVLVRRRRGLDGLLRRIAWARLEDVVIPDAVDGEIHLDLVLLTPRGILVLDVRRVHGTLFWGERLERWTVLDGARRKSLANPMPGLRARRHAVHAIAPRVPVDGRVLLVGQPRFSGAAPPGVILVEDLAVDYPARDRTAPPPPLAEAWAALKSAARPA